MAESLISMETPSDLEFGDLVFCLDCHPMDSVVASGCIDGSVTLHSYSLKQNVCKRRLHHHKKSCRAVRFSPSGRRLYTASKDKSVWCIDVETGGIRRKIKPAHSSPINALEVTGERFVATGDDDGTIKLWDMRTKEAVMEWKECDDFISDMIVDNDQKILLATSGDGTLSAFNIRRKRMDLQSELHDSELLSLCSVKGQQKVVCGSGDGVLYLFNWGEWGNMSDRFPGHPSSVTCMRALNDDIICTGSNDGKIRVVNILPNRFLGVVGEHEFDVEGVSLSHDRRYLLSCSHDQLVKFWSLADVDKEKVDASKKAKHSNKSRKLGGHKKNDFFSGLVDNAGDGKEGGGSDEDSDGDDDDDSDDSDE